ncbi:hypothetical protein DFQ27_006270 [Actinomortierella ambigua]|uniref:Uncharacterized protein n=1 Tax=Actinomortierella ambigua TaxID=1343610 RepID=A0A9P6PWC7_9FUNG|nr:hypothetical protein DFQ27_006270 [Actinomortierella ambigua]
MIPPGIIVAVSFGVVATGFVLYTIFREEIHDLFEKPSTIPSNSRPSKPRRKRGDKNDSGSSSGYSTARDGSHDGYELRSRRCHSVYDNESDNENEKDDNDNDDDEHKRLLNKELEADRRERELAEKLARLDLQERLLNEREERLKQQLAREQDTSFASAAATAAAAAARRISSPPSTPNEMSQSASYFLMPSISSSLHEQQHSDKSDNNNNNSVVDPFADDFATSHQLHPLELPRPSSSSSSPSRASPVPALSSLSVSAPAPAVEHVDSRSPADAILHHDLSEQRNPFEESSIYMDTSSSSIIREDVHEDVQGRPQQQQQPQQQQEEEGQQYQQQFVFQAEFMHESLEVEAEDDETVSFHGGVSSDPEWVEADVDSDLHSNFSDYDDWSSSSAHSP